MVFWRNVKRVQQLRARLSPVPELQNEHFSARRRKKQPRRDSPALVLSPAGVDGWRLMLVSEARASMSQESTRVRVARANRSAPPPNGRRGRPISTRALRRRPAPFEWNTHHVTPLERWCQKVEGESAARPLQRRCPV